MGELFRQVHTDTRLTWTGERMVPGQTGAIEAEHFHRYFLARDLCRGLDVLDVASGEGYGSAFLAQTASHVTGVEVDPATVEHARHVYEAENLQFVHGEATNLPIEDHSVDVVVSFETIEHFADHRRFLAEVKRVLRPNGFLLISTPDMNVYSAAGTESNPFHVKELTEAEFRAILSSSFRKVELLRQRAISGSAILPDTSGPGTNSLSIFEHRDGLTYEASPGLLRAPYLLAVASDHALPAVGVSLFIQKQYEEELRAAAQKTYQEWSQRIQAEEQYAKAIAELEQVKQQYNIDLRAAVEKTHSEWTQRVHAEEAHAGARLEMEKLRAALQAEAEKTHLEWSQRVHTEEELAKARSELIEEQQKAQSELAKTQEALRSVQFEQSALIKKLSESRTEADFFRAQHQSALSSRSWKLTAPLRAGTSLLKRLKRRTTRDQGPSVGTPAQGQAQTDSNGEDSEGCGIPVGQDAWDRFGRARLANLLGTENYLEVGASDHPLVSVLLVLFNQAHLTLLAIESILCNSDVDYELIIVDNASTDMTGELLRHLRGAHVIRNQSNLGFGPACVQAAEVARGQYLCFMNNDALLEPRAFSSALENFSQTDRVGAVGGKILLADGRLQEAGSIVWSDGSALGYGRSDNPNLPAYQFRRPVDYCSAAFLFTPRSLFFELGGFKEEFAPAYYEDTDYCLRVWQHGLQVVYEPRAVIRHFESASSGGNEAAQLQMAANQSKFVEVWEQTLPRYLAPATSNVLRARIAASSTGLRILYLDDRVPHRELGSGFPRSNDILQHLVSLGHHVACVALSFPLSLQSDEYRDIPREVELIDACSDCTSVLREYLPASDLVWVSRPHNMERLLQTMSHLSEPCQKPIVYDAEAIFSDRDRLKAEITGRKISPQLLTAQSAMEAALAQAADVTLAVSERDARTLKTLGVQEVRVLGFCLEAVPTDESYARRAMFLFVGAVHDDDNPNLDSLRFFCREVWPTVQESTGAELVIAGFGTEKFADELRSPGIRIVGAQDDLRALYQSARVFVVPTRYCAGVPYKALESAAHGVPMVVTPIIHEQLGWTDGKEYLVGADAAKFAQRCIHLFTDEVLWNTLRSNALQNVRDELNRDAFGARVAGILGRVTATSDNHSSTQKTYSTRPPNRPLIDPVIAHVHVPKCGGWAFRNFLQRQYGPAHLSLYVSDTFFVYSEEELAGYLNDRAVRSFSSHFVRTFPERLAGRDLLYITFLRNPVDQFISYITYAKKYYHDLEHDKPLMSCLPPELPSLSIRDAARWILTQDRDVNFRENYTVNYFARYTLARGAGRPNGNEYYRQNRLAAAQRTLQRFFFVGVVEEMERSMSLLKKLMGQCNLEFPPGEVLLENTSFDFRGDLSWIRIDDEVGSLLLESVREDQQLYNWAEARLRDVNLS